MKKELLLGVFIILMFAACVGEEDAIQEITVDQVDTIVQESEENEEQEEDENEEQEENDEEENESSTVESIAYHNQGESCLSCHAYPATEADGEDFLSGGTIYTTLDSTNLTNLASSYSIRLQLDNEQLLNYELDTNHGDANSYSEDSRVLSYEFTAQVIDSNGNLVNSSKTYSHNYAQLDCNSCHTQTGNSGAPGRIVSYDYTQSIVVVSDTQSVSAPAKISFSDDVFPILEINCQSCHGDNGRYTVTTVDATYSNILSFNGLNIVTPTDSTLLTNANGVNHYKILSDTSTEYITIRDWISEGGLNN